MHELSITQSVVDAVAEHTDGAPVASVRLRIGKLSGVVPDALRFCFELVTEGTGLQGATLEWLVERAITALNLMSSPGSGKTTLLVPGGFQGNPSGLV